MNKVYIITAITFISLMGLTSCKKDKEVPTITVNEPADHTELMWGDQLHIEATFEDDRELESYRVYLGNQLGVKSTDFDIDFTGTISGTSYDFHDHVMVPDSVGMVYYLHFEVSDAEGKTTSASHMLHFMP
ncbi:DUF4625 domain-containing protein [Crocinitomix catalasitica]|uniref:DUF4625 domain-containing protein n=1 Tax=Crocinitomix catalasitica TaxID=184607 RepID=UPI000484CA72|nr:DUF4625 domain-containing protein [Crocinitomix catalasitica]